jgi:hypothetical protein
MFGNVERMAAPRIGLLTRRIVLSVSALLCMVGLVRIGRSFVVDGSLRLGNPISDAPKEQAALLVAQPLTVRAEVTRVAGSAGVRLGETCQFLVEQRPRDARSFYCNAQVMCGGKLLYGGPDRGFFACRFYDGERRDVVGADPSTTRQDKDGALSLDTRSGVLRVWDDASGPSGEFQVEAEVLSAQ